MNDSVKKLLKESMWDLATCANGEPNVVPVAFKDVTPDGKLVVGDVFLDTTLKNLAANGGKIAISVYDAKTLEGYQIKGVAEYVTKGEVVKTFKAMVEQIRGVDSAYSVAALLNKKLIEEAGRLNVPGRPIQYRTTPDFLRTFGLSTLEELPPIDKIAFGEPIELPQEEKTGEES